MSKNRLIVAVSILLAVVIGLTGCSRTTTKPPASEDVANVIETDVVVIGSGAAGLSAALAAGDEGVQVIVLEKRPLTGGTTRYSGGGLCAAGVDLQLKHGITEDSPEVHFEDMMRLGQYENDPDLVRVVTNNAKDAVDWIRTKGIQLKDEVVSYMSTYPRIYWVEGGGSGLTDGLTKTAEESGIKIELDTKAVKLLMEEDRVVGVVAQKGNEEITYRTRKGVVLATGGFAWNQDLIKEFAPELTGIRTNNPENVTTGDGIIMARNIGAQLVDMNLARIVPLGVRVGKSGWTSAPGTLIESGGQFVNNKGLAFVAEGTERDLAAAILAQPEHTAYLIFDQQVVNEVGEKSIETLKNRGAIHEGDLTAITQKLGIDADGLEQTLGQEKSQETVFGVVVEPYIHSTTGGVAINTSGQVLNESEEVIQGLYAAGEVTGDIQGADPKNALIDCLVFGRIAGESASVGK